LQILNRLSKDEVVLADVSSGKAKVKFMDASRVSMFSGKVDITNLRVKDGKYSIIHRADLTKDKSAFGSPDVAVKDGSILRFEKYDVTQKPNPRYAEEGERARKVKKEYSVSFDEPTKDELSEEPISDPKITFDAKFSMTGSQLKQMVQSKEYEDSLVIEADEDNISMKREPSQMMMYDEEGNEKKEKPRPLELKGKYGKESDLQYLDWARGGTKKAVYNVDYLRMLADSVGKDSRLLVEFAHNMPLKASILNDPNVEGDWWLAPKIEEEY